MAGEVFAVLEVEFVLAALLGRARRDVAVLRRVAEDVGAELLVHQDAGLRLGNAAGEGLLEAVVDHPLHGGDLRRLLAVSEPVQPNMFFWNVPRWSKGRM